VKIIELGIPALKQEGYEDTVSLTFYSSVVAIYIKWLLYTVYIYLTRLQYNNLRLKKYYR